MKTKRFKEEDYSKYFPNDTESDNTTTNRYRFYRVHYWAQKLAEDLGAELLIFGYFPNKKVGSCGAWQLGEKTKDLVKESTINTFMNFWEKISTKMEGKHCFLFSYYYCDI